MDEAVVVSGPPSDLTSPVAHGELEMTERTTTPTTPTHPATENETVTGLKSIDDFELPKTIIARLLKGVLPDGTQLQKDAKSAFSRAATVFISYLTDTTFELAQKGGRKVLTAQDVMKALADLDFSEFLPRVESHVQEHHRQTALKKKSKSLTNLNEDETENPPEDPIVLVEEETLSPTTSSTSHKRKALLVTQPSPNVDMAVDVRSRSSSPKRVKKVEEQVEVEQVDIEEVDNSADIDVDSTSNNVDIDVDSTSPI